MSATGTAVPEPGSPLPLDLVGAAVKSVLSNGLTYTIQDDPPAIRVAGLPGHFDPFFPTWMWFGDGNMRVECAIPVLVPLDRRVEVLELCLLLNRQARVGFTLDSRDTPLVCASCDLLAHESAVAADRCGQTLQLLWQRATATEKVFRQVAKGASAHEAAAHLFSADQQQRDPRGFLLSTREGVPLPGSRWNGLLDGIEMPAGVSAPDGYTAAEMLALFTVFGRLTAGGETGMLDACPGPLLIHADGVVECFGCTDPGQVSHHLSGSTVECRDRIYLGPGHRCERCGSDA
jgi:hypothetical protein